MTKYQKRISGPLLDCIDIYIEVPGVDYEKLNVDRLGEFSAPFGHTSRRRGTFNELASPNQSIKQISKSLNQSILFVMPTCASGRFGSFAGCQTRAKADAGRHGAAQPVGAHLSPHPEAGAYHRGSDRGIAIQTKVNVELGVGPPGWRAMPG